MIRPILQRDNALILLSAAAFAAGIPAGLIAYPLVEDRLPEIIGQAFGGIMSGTDVDVILKVFMRNATASLIVLLFGMTVIVPPIILAANGFVIGLILRFATDKGLRLSSIALGIIPHGIFELPAIFVSAALGMRVGLQLLTQKGRRIRAAAEAVREAAIVYVSLVVPLLAVAALVEILVSKKLM